MLFMTFTYFQSGYENNLVSANALFHATAWPFYAFLYLLPAFIPLWALQAISPHRLKLCQVLALLLTSLCLIYIWTDRLIFDLYSFHINRFVLNLVFTEGGIDSLNSSGGTYVSISLVVIRILLLQGAAMFLVLNRDKLTAIFPVPGTTHVGGLLLGLFLIQGVTYGIGDVTNKASVLEHAYDYPFFQKIRFRTLAGKLGYAVQDRGRSIRTSDNSRLQYPLHAITFDEVESPPNIVWLVAESLRWDQLTPEIMPNTWSFANNSWHFLNHYSSGNGTREGMFGMFYGLYGSYWDSFVHAGQSPLVMDRMQTLGYQFDLRTGAKFTYPEFDKTILARLPDDVFHEANQDLSPWQRDETNTTAMLKFLRQNQEQSAAPFMTFQFFESTHAPYFFPDDEAIKAPYLDNLNYADLSKEYLAENIDGIFNRYSNSAFWVDQQIGRILDTLAQQGLMKNTIVIITGDHGEEFMEKGNWGHNSTFTEEQTHVPLVLKLPGKGPEQITMLTSHLDIATTVLESLGAPSVIENYSLGLSLVDMQPRESIIISDWHSIAVVTNDMKIRIPYISIGFDNWQPTDASDHALNKGSSDLLINRYQQTITNAMQNSTVFSTSPQ